MSKDKEDKSFVCVLSIYVSIFITFLIFFTYIFAINVVKNLFPVFTPIVNQENIILLFTLLIFSFFQYCVYFGGTVLAERQSNNNIKKFPIKSVISFLFLLLSLIIPFFICFFYLKNLYSIFEQFFITGKINWIVYLTIFLINYIILYLGSFILKPENFIEKIISGIFGFPAFSLFSIFVSIPLIIHYFISKIVPFLYPLCLNCSTGIINWLSILGIFFIYFILFIPLLFLISGVGNFLYSVFNLIKDIFVKKIYFDKKDIEKELVIVFNKTIKKSKHNPEILKDSNIFKGELKKISEKSKLVNFLDKKNYDGDSYKKYIDYIDDDILSLYFDSDENINYRLDLIKSIFETNRKKTEEFIDYYFIDHIMDAFYQVLKLDKIKNPPIKYKNVKLNDKIFEKLYKIGLINTSDKFALSFINIPKIFKFKNKYYKITKIGKKFFKDCTNLKEVIIPESVIKICNYAFKNCKNLKKIGTPKKLTEIGIGAFENCTSLNSPYTLSAFSHEISFDYIEKIGKYAFKNCKHIKFLNIGKKIKKIEKGTFENCYLLKNIFFMPKEIGDYAFKNCKSLYIYSFNLEEVKYIGKKAFYGCKFLDILYFKNILQIGDKAFAYCSSIKEVEISDTIEKIGDYAFKNCKLLNQIIIPKKLKKIGIGAFQNIGNLIYDGDLDTGNITIK